MCCAPCSVYPVSALQEDHMELEGLFFNPNIHPIDEFLRRKENVERFTGEKGIPLTVMEDFRQNEWEAFAGEADQRCRMCYAVRFEQAAKIAKERGFDAFSTSLLVSPYQKHDLIRELGEKLGKKYGVPFYYRDFRPGFRQGQQQAREMGLYRQKFCGCIISYNESPHTKKKEEANG
jgi:epoxyqueuosine reductase